MFVLKITRGFVLRLIVASLLMILTLNTFSMEAGPKDVEQIVNTMVKSGMIPASSAKALKEKMKNMSPEQWKQMNDTAKKLQGNPQLLNDITNKMKVNN